MSINYSISSSSTYYCGHRPISPPVKLRFAKLRRVGDDEPFDCFVSKTGRYGGTFAHRDIAFELASLLSAEFKFYLIKELQHLKEEEQKQISWTAKHELAKINYHIHTEAINQNLIPAKLTKSQINFVYANKADVLNMDMFGITAKEWRDANPDLKGNIRDYATINELICISNMENLNALFVKENMPQSQRLIRLNQIAIQQMKVLVEVDNRKLLKEAQYE